METTTEQQALALEEPPYAVRFATAQVGAVPTRPNGWRAQPLDQDDEVVVWLLWDPAQVDLALVHGRPDTTLPDALLQAGYHHLGATAHLAVWSRARRSTISGQRRSASCDRR